MWGSFQQVVSALQPSQYDSAMHRLNNVLDHLWTLQLPLQQPILVENVPLSPTQVVTLEDLVPDSLGFPSSALPSQGHLLVDPAQVVTLDDLVPDSLGFPSSALVISWLILQQCIRCFLHLVQSQIFSVMSALPVFPNMLTLLLDVCTTKGPCLKVKLSSR